MPTTHVPNHFQAQAKARLNNMNNDHQLNNISMLKTHRRIYANGASSFSWRLEQINKTTCIVVICALKMETI